MSTVAERASRMDEETDLRSFAAKLAVLSRQA